MHVCKTCKHETLCKYTLGPCKQQLQAWCADNHINKHDADAYIADRLATTHNALVYTSK
jgi:hypothetical protein